jgi:beta-galactosidase
MDDREREEKRHFELCKYVIHYADGQTVEVPVFAEVDIDHFQQKEPKSIPGAQLAWTGRFEGSDESAVLYAKQWNNPRPGVELRSVDMLYGKDKDRGVPALIAITAASTVPGFQ